MFIDDSQTSRLRLYRAPDRRGDPMVGVRRGGGVVRWRTIQMLRRRLQLMDSGLLEEQGHVDRALVEFGGIPEAPDACFLRGVVSLRPLEEVFAAQELCITGSRMTSRADVSATCRDAYNRIQATDDPEGLKMILGAFGEIAFRAGRMREAVDLWNRSLADDGVDLPAAPAGPGPTGAAS